MKNSWFGAFLLMVAGCAGVGMQSDAGDGAKLTPAGERIRFTRFAKDVDGCEFIYAVSGDPRYPSDKNHALMANDAAAGDATHVFVGVKLDDAWVGNAYRCAADAAVTTAVTP